MAHRRRSGWEIRWWLRRLRLSVLVLVFAGLFLRTLTNLKSVNPGFDTSNILTFGIDPTRSDYEPERIQRLYRDFQQRLAAIPGVTVRQLFVGRADQRKLVDRRASACVGAKDKSSIHVQLFAVGPQFFETLRIPVLAGRGFNVRGLCVERFGRRREPGLCTELPERWHGAGAVP